MPFYMLCLLSILQFHDKKDANLSFVIEYWATLHLKGEKYFRNFLFGSCDSCNTQSYCKIPNHNTKIIFYMNDLK